MFCRSVIVTVIVDIVLYVVLHLLSLINSYKLS